MKMQSVVLAALPLAFAATALAQEPAGTVAKPELPVIAAKLGPCSADFTVTDGDKKPVYDATIHVRVRYGAFNLKRMDLEVGTNSDGKARVESLPSKAKLLAYDISKGDTHASVTQDVAIACTAKYDVTLK